MTTTLPARLAATLDRLTDPTHIALDDARFALDELNMHLVDLDFYDDDGNTVDVMGLIHAVEDALDTLQGQIGRQP